MKQLWLLELEVVGDRVVVKMARMFRTICGHDIVEWRGMLMFYVLFLAPL